MWYRIAGAVEYQRSNPRTVAEAQSGPWARCSVALLCGLNKSFSQMNTAHKTKSKRGMLCRFIWCWYSLLNRSTSWESLDRFIPWQLNSRLWLVRRIVSHPGCSVDRIAVICEHEGLWQRSGIVNEWMDGVLKLHLLYHSLKWWLPSDMYLKSCN